MYIVKNMNSGRPKLEISTEDRKRLRKARIRLADIAELDAASISQLLDLPEQEARNLIFSAQVQRFHSIGPATAADLLALGTCSLPALAAAEPAELYRGLERIAKAKLDPCVEDELRCAVAQARWPDLTQAQRNWWAWMDQRGKSLVRPKADAPATGAVAEEHQ